jgi:cytochrome b561
MKTNHWKWGFLALAIGFFCLFLVLQKPPPRIPAPEANMVAVKKNQNAPAKTG